MVLSLRLGGSEGVGDVDPQLTLLLWGHKRGPMGSGFCFSEDRVQESVLMEV